MYKIVGIMKKTLTFDDKDTGKKRFVNGYQVFCTDDSRPKVDGVATMDFFMSENVCNRSKYNPQLDDCIEAILFNRYGRLFRVLPFSPN